MVAVTLDGKKQYLAKTQNLDNLEIANVWSLGFWVKPKPSKEFGMIFSVGTAGGENAIEISTTAISTETEQLGKRSSQLRVMIKGSDGTIIKHYGWKDHFKTNTWTHTGIYWDGTALEAFKDGAPTVTGTVLVSGSASISGGVMTDSVRSIFYGSVLGGGAATFSGSIGHLGMWDVQLSDAEFGTIISGGHNADLTVSSGSYTSQGNLQHYYKPGEDGSDIGKDFTTTGTPAHLDKLLSVTSGTNVVQEVPG